MNPSFVPCADILGTVGDIYDLHLEVKVGLIIIVKRSKEDITYELKSQFLPCL